MSLTRALTQCWNTTSCMFMLQGEALFLREVSVLVPGLVAPIYSFD